MIATRAWTSGASRLFGAMLVLALLPAAAAAQDTVPPEVEAPLPPASRFEFGAKFGGSLTSMTNVSVVSQTRNDFESIALVPEGTVFAGIRLSDRLGLQFDFSLATKAARLPDDSDADDLNDERRVAIRYVEIPVQLKFTAPGTATQSLYVLMGPTLSRRLSATLSTGHDKEVITDRILTAAWGATAAIGLQGRHWLVEARYSQGLRHIAVEDDKGTVWPRAISMMAGIRF